MTGRRTRALPPFWTAAVSLPWPSVPRPNGVDLFGCPLGQTSPPGVLSYAECVLEQGPGLVQVPLPVRPAVGARAVEVELCRDLQRVQPPGEGGVFCGERRLDHAGLRARRDRAV